MEQKQAEVILSGLVDLLENKQGLIRTRKTGESVKVKDDKHTFPNDTGDKWYKYEQKVATFRLDCDELKNQDAITALDAITNGLFKIVVIAEQNALRSLTQTSVDGKISPFDRAFESDVEVNVFERLSKSAGKPIDPAKVTKQLNTLSATEKATIIVSQLRSMGHTDEQINEFLAKKDN